MRNWGVRVSQSSNMLDFYAVHFPDPLWCLVTRRLQQPSESSLLLPITMTKHYASERDERKSQGRKHGADREEIDTERRGCEWLDYPACMNASRSDPSPPSLVDC